jgi:hypothetical protein
MGSADFDIGYSLCVDHLNNVLIAGSFRGTVDFDPGVNTFNMVSPGGSDIFVLKLDSSRNFAWARRIGGTADDAARSIMIDDTGGVYTTGRFGGIVDFNPATATYNMDAYYGDIFVSKLNSLGNFVWAKHFGSRNSYDYNQFISLDAFHIVIIAGAFTDSGDFNPGTGINWLASLGGPDSYVLKLNFCNSTVSISPSRCISYKSPSGKFTWTSSGNYVDTLPNANGCDSLIIVNLTIKTVEDSVINNSRNLTAFAAGATYQWLDCNNNFAIIPGATGKSFIPSGNGIYAVKISQNGCIDTSACEAITSVGVEEYPESEIEVFPNPTKGQFTIALGRQHSEILAVVISESGQEVLKKRFNSVSNFVLMLDGEAGTYYVEIISGDRRRTVKIIKN